MQLSTTKRRVQRGLWDLAIAGSHEGWTDGSTDANVREEHYRAALNRFTVAAEELQEDAQL